MTRDESRDTSPEAGCDWTCQEHVNTVLMLVKEISEDPTTPGAAIASERFRGAIAPHFCAPRQLPVIKAGGLERLFRHGVGCGMCGPLCAPLRRRWEWWATWSSSSKPS